LAHDEVGAVRHSERLLRRQGSAGSLLIDAAGNGPAQDPGEAGLCRRYL
jgi:hypothetical protein